MKSLFLVFFVCALTACNGMGFSIKRNPIPENCEATCRTPCTAAGIEYITDPNTKDALNDLTETVVIPLRKRLTQCDTHRQSCVQCLDRLKEAGLTK